MATSFFGELRVLDLSTSYCARLVAMALGDLGAQVVRVRREGERALFTDRHSQLLDPSALTHPELETLMARSDVILEDLPLMSLVAMEPANVLSPEGVIHCWMPAFDVDDSVLGEVVGREHAVAAASGMMDRPMGRKPSLTHLSVLSVSAAAYALNGILGALMARRRDGQGQQVKLVRSDVAYAVLELNALLTRGAPKAWTPLQWAATPWIGAYRCSGNGWLYIHAGLERHLHRLLEAFDELNPSEARKLRAHLSEQTLRDPTSVPSPREVRATSEALGQMMMQHPAWFWEKKLSQAGLCAVQVCDGASWFGHVHAKATGQVIPWEGHPAPGPATTSERDALELPDAPTYATLEQALEGWSVRESTAHDGATSAHAPLHGVKVLDLTQVIAGPACGRMLAELGAQVHRIENPHFGAPWVDAFHVAYNAGKSQEVLDLNKPEQRAHLERLLQDMQPDVVLHNFRPGAAQKLGLDEQSVRALLPQVVYASLSAYGDEGPWGQRPGWEQTAQAATGIQWDWGDCPERPPELYPLPLNDLATGLFAASGVVAALLTSEDEVPVRHPKAALSRTATWMQAWGHCVTHEVVRGPGQTGRAPLHRFYKAYDGWVFLDVAPDQQKALLHVMGLEHIPAYEDPRLQTRALERAFLTARVDEWTRRALNAGVRARVAIVPWRSQAQMLRSERASARGFVFTRVHPGLGRVTETSSALALSRTTTIHPLPPAPGRPHARDRQTLKQSASWLRGQAVGVASLFWRASPK